MTMTIEEREPGRRWAPSEIERLRAELAAAHEELGQVRDELRRTIEQAHTAGEHRARAEQACRAREEFVAMLGHELRNPLSPIITALHLMRQKADTGVGRERAAIERQVELLVRLVDDLLDVSRLATGKIELRRARCDVAEVIESAVELVGPAIEQRRHRLEVEAAAGTLWVDGDRARLVQVLVNLIGNAAKYTAPGGWIGVRASRAGAWIVIEVRDDGIGIDGDLLPRVFDTFVQGRAGGRGASADAGLGIGLAIVRTLVTLHGGEVTAASQGAGTGSTFTVRLPRAEPDAPEVTPPPPPPRQRILVVDDNIDVAELYAEVLRRHGHVVVVAHSGQAALQIARTFRPDAALVDIGLPVLDGVELAAALRAQLGEACPRLIAITGYADDRERDRSLRAGFERHLVKPIDMRQLLGLFGDRPGAVSG